MKKRTTRAAVSFLLVCFCSLCAESQSVLLPAVVVDQSGRAVHGLKKSDFVVNCGKSVSFDSVEEVPPIDLHGFGDQIPVFILYDPFSMDPVHQDRVSKMLLAVLQQAADRHLAVTVMKNNGTGMALVHDLATPNDILAAALNRVRGDSSPEVASSTPDAGPDFKIKVNEEVRRLGELKQLALNKQFGYNETISLHGLEIMSQMLQRSRQRKLLVWIAGYFKATVGPGELKTPNTRLAEGHVFFMWDVYPAYRAAMQALNRSRISVFPLSVGDEPRIAARSGSHASEIGMEVVTALKGVASQTGGRFLGNVDEVDVGTNLAELRRNFDSYYVVSLSAQPEKRETWSAIEIGVKHPDSKVTAPSGFILAK